MHTKTQTFSAVNIRTATLYYHVSTTALYGTVLRYLIAARYNGGAVTQGCAKMEAHLNFVAVVVLFLPLCSRSHGPGSGKSRVSTGLCVATV